MKNSQKPVGAEQRGPVPAAPQGVTPDAWLRDVMTRIRVGLAVQLEAEARAMLVTANTLRAP